MQYVEIFLKVFTAIGVVAGIYNIFSSRKIVQDQGQKAKVEQALTQGLENKKDIEHLKELINTEKEHTKNRLDQIGEDIGFVKDLLVKWLLDPNRKS